MKQLLSPKQVAASIGASESSLKRWCDRGVIATERTPGGHRRIRIGEAIRFLREHQHTLVKPETLGLPAGTGRGHRSIAKASTALHEALATGDSDQSRRVVMDSFFAGNSVLRLCEELITPVLHTIGDDWKCGKLEVFQEHRACEVLNRILYDLRAVLPPPKRTAPVAIGGTPPGDNYRLATLMVEVVLAGEGWDARSLGSSLPFETMAAAVDYHQPRLFWMSFSHIADERAAQEGFERFLSAISPAVQVVVGGQCVTDWLIESDDRRVRYCRDLPGLREAASSLWSSEPTALAE